MVVSDYPTHSEYIVFSGVKRIKGEVGSTRHAIVSGFFNMNLCISSPIQGLTERIMLSSRDTTKGTLRLNM